MGFKEVTKSSVSHKAFDQGYVYVFLLDGQLALTDGDRQYSEAIGWCWDQFGPGSAFTFTGAPWAYFSWSIAFRDHATAIEFKLRWC